MTLTKFNCRTIGGAEGDGAVSYGRYRRFAILLPPERLSVVDPGTSLVRSRHHDASRSALQISHHKQHWTHHLWSWHTTARRWVLACNLQLLLSDTFAVSTILFSGASMALGLCRSAGGTGREGSELPSGSGQGAILLSLPSGAAHREALKLEQAVSHAAPLR